MEGTDYLALLPDGIQVPSSLKGLAKKYLGETGRLHIDVSQRE